MGRFGRLWLLLVALAAGPAAAQQVATSAAPERVSVTVYRDPGRPAANPMNLRWLNGFALISEVRTISVPAGESELRFEGVAGGILPQSAIVAGLPDGIVERNRDAYLLSPGSLLDRSLGRRVHLRRTSRATGATVEEEAVVRSGASGAVVIETEAGFEALRCTGIAETLVYDEVPPGLSARPTLSVRARSARAFTATITLSYIASGFDWQADYVAELDEDSGTMRLFAWMTLANGDETGFRDAETLAVAGRLARRNLRAQPPEAPPLRLRCWPHSTTADIPPVALEQQLVVFGRRVGRPELAMAAPPPPPPPAPAPAMVAEQEDLGDLKLYRIPEPVTVAANSQKQVALLVRPEVRQAQLYRLQVPMAGEMRAMPAQRLLVTRNLATDGLGIPLPAGQIVFFAERGGERMLVGRGFLADRAVGEDVEIAVGPATGVLVDQVTEAEASGRLAKRVTATNDRSVPIRFQLELVADPSWQPLEGVPTSRRNGNPLWEVEVPANGSAELRYRLEWVNR